jgi:hypothetical protein
MDQTRLDFAPIPNPPDHPLLDYLKALKIRHTLLMPATGYSGGPRQQNISPQNPAAA